MKKKLSEINLILIEQSNVILMFGLVALTSSLYFLELSIHGLVYGASAGLLLGFIAPTMWKMDRDLLNFIISFSVILWIPILLSKSFDEGFLTFQMISILIVSTSAVWFARKDQLIDYLKN